MSDNSSSLFTMADYLVFSATLVISLAIGVYYAFTGGKQNTTSEYLMAGRKMHFLPVAISMFVTYKSSIMVLGYPAEVYVYGIQVVVTLLPHLLANVMSVWIVVPLMYPLQITSAYEYLELRFKSRGVRRLGSTINMMQDIWYIGIVIYGCATALEAVTSFPFWVCAVGLTSVSVVYTSIGGLKAVIWTDVFQSAVMLVGMCAVLIKGTLDAGGTYAVWETAERGGRLNFFNFDADPRVRHTFWNLCMYGFLCGFDTAFKQSTIQRLGSTATISGAKKVLLFEGPAALLVCVMAACEGIIAFAYFTRKGCDPLKSRQLSNPNQILPFLVTDMFSSSYGLPGCFIASLCAACLSTVSSCLSSISALVWTDMVHPLVGDVGERKATVITKTSVLVTGILATGFAWLISQIGGPIKQISGVIIGTFFGPLLGLFFLGCYSPRANAKGVIIGSILAFALTSWMSVGRTLAPALKRTPFLAPAATATCGVQLAMSNDSDLSSLTTSNKTGIHILETATLLSPRSSASDTEPQGINKMYTLSYTFIPFIGTVLSLLFGYIFSILTGGNRDGEIDPRYLLSVTDTWLICFPKPIRRVLGCKKTTIQTDQWETLDAEKAENPLLWQSTPPNDSTPDGQQRHGIDTNPISDVRLHLLKKPN